MARFFIQQLKVLPNESSIPNKHCSEGKFSTKALHKELYGSHIPESRFRNQKKVYCLDFLKVIFLHMSFAEKTGDFPDLIISID